MLRTRIALFIDLLNSPSERIFFAFLALMIWSPLPLGSNRPWSSSFFELLVFILSFYCLWLNVKGKLEVGDALRNAKLPLACLSVFSVFIFIQIIPLPSKIVSLFRPVNPSLESAYLITLSIDPFSSFSRFRLSVSFTLLAAIFLVVVNTRRRVRLFAGVIVVSGVFQALYGSIMTLTGWEWGFFVPKQAYFGFATGTFVNRNHYANYLVMCLAVGTSLLLADLYKTSSGSWQERRRRWLEALLGNKLRLRMGLALMVIALVLTRSRMGNTSFFLGLIVTGGLWLFFTKRFTRGSLLLLVSLIVIDTFIVGTWFGIDELKERLETTSAASEERVLVNRDTIPLLQDYWILGSGAGTFYNAFTMYRQADIRMTYDHAHNDYFQLLAEHGIFACLALVTLVVSAVLKSIRVLQKRKSLMFRSMAFAPIMAVMAVLVHSSVEFNLQIPANAILFIALLVMPWNLSWVPSGGQRISRLSD